MEMEEYKPNSYKSKEASKEDKKIEKVVTGTVKTKKKSEVHKFKDVFISEDASSVKSYIFMDVLVPAVKKVVVDMIKEGVEMLVYGESGRRSGRDKDRGLTNYVRYSDRDRRDDRFSDSRHSRSSYSYDDIILPSRGEAEKILLAMDDVIEKYGVVSVGDLNEMCGIDGNYTDNRYGWTNISRAEPVRTRDGFMLKLPRAMPID